MGLYFGASTGLWFLFVELSRLSLGLSPPMHVFATAQGEGSTNTGSLHGVYGLDKNKFCPACECVLLEMLQLVRGNHKDRFCMWRCFSHSGCELFFKAFSDRMMMPSLENGG